MFDVKDYQEDINELARRFVDILERAITATGNDPVALETNGQTVMAAIALALDAEKAKRFGPVKP